MKKNSPKKTKKGRNERHLSKRDKGGIPSQEEQTCVQCCAIVNTHDEWIREDVEQFQVSPNRPESPDLLLSSSLLSPPDYTNKSQGERDKDNVHTMGGRGGKDERLNLLEDADPNLTSFYAIKLHNTELATLNH